MQAFSVKASGVCSNHRVVKTKTNLTYHEEVLSYGAVNTFLLFYKNQSVNSV
jgi:hypothetical protein